MAYTIEELQGKVSGAAERVEKIKGTILKHEAAAAKRLATLEKVGVTLDNMNEKFNDSTYEVRHLISEYKWKISDVEGAQRKLKDAAGVLSNWQRKLDIEIEKERFLNDQAPEVIKEFLEQWKQKAYAWHMRAYNLYVELMDELSIADEALNLAFSENHPNGRRWGKEFENFTKYSEQGQAVRSIKSKLSMMGIVVSTMYTYKIESARVEFLNKVLEDDKRAKMFDLINRVNAIVGTITDAALLRVSEEGNLNGYIDGEKGRAKVETIGAGGWNIQCFHFRTLVHEIKKGE